METSSDLKAALWGAAAGAAALAMIALCSSADLASAQPVPGPANTPRSPAGEASKPNAHEAAIADCERMWDRGTHMTKIEWSQTCRRVQYRLQHLEIR